MKRTLHTRDSVLDAIRTVAKQKDRPPSGAELKAETGVTREIVLKYFDNWPDAIRAAGLEPRLDNVRIAESDLLEDWASFVREHRRLPKKHEYDRQKKYSPAVFHNRFQKWSNIPKTFLNYAKDKPQWADVVAVLEESSRKVANTLQIERPLNVAASSNAARHSKLGDRPTYGNPIDFRGLRHEPVNEGGVVFLFGMIAKELGYMVEAIQAGFPDCEAKRRVSEGKWERVLIEFEFESRNFRDHGHQASECDVIVCWRHNWLQCPIEVIEISKVIEALKK